MAAIARSVLTLAVLAGASAAVLEGLEVLTAPRVQMNAERARTERAARLLRDVAYDNAPHRDVVVVRSEGAGAARGPAVGRVLRARRGGRPAALIIEVSTPQGYGGEVRLLVAVTEQGTVIDTTVLAHRETPGLGDRVSSGPVSWLDRFDGRSLDDPAPEGWRLRAEGGAFDALTGATVTSRAVLGAVASALAFRARYRCTIFEIPAGGVLDETPDADAGCAR